MSQSHDSITVAAGDDSAYRAIPAAVYFPRLAGVHVPERGNISCPSPLHEDETPSCSVRAHGFCCHGCGAHGGIFDLSSLMKGGPTGNALAADTTALAQAKQAVSDACSDLL